MRKLLTHAFIRSLEKPATGRIEVADLRCVGLTLRVTSSGAKSWSLRFRDPRSGKVSRATIGTYPDTTLEKARGKGLAMRREVAEGITRATPTSIDLFFNGVQGFAESSSESIAKLKTFETSA